MTEDQELHSLISEVKSLAQELGQSPGDSQCRAHIRNYQYRCGKVFKRHSEILELAGLSPVRNRKLTNSIFEKDIQEHIENYISKDLPEKKEWPTIAILGDLHEPFGSDNVKSDFISFCEKTKPSYVIQMGDLFDMYSHTKFPRSQNLFTPKEEEDLAKKRVSEFWSSVQKSSPKSKCIGILGNHDIRPLKRTLESVPQMEHWIEKYFKELMSFDNVEMILDVAQEYIISDIVFIHGYLNKLGAHRDYTLMNVVRGHDHVGGVSFKQIHGRTLWELDAGLAGDFNAKGFNYRNQKMTNWTNGFAAVDSLGPRFIPLR
jgi:predicted phosphodiesterase